MNSIHIVCFLVQGVFNANLSSGPAGLLNVMGHPSYVVFSNRKANIYMGLSENRVPQN